MISDIYSMETKRIVSRFGCSFFYEGSHAEFLSAGILDAEQRVPKKRGGTVNVSYVGDNCGIVKITMIASGKLRIWAKRDLAAERSFLSFLRATLRPLPSIELIDDSDSI